MDPTIIIGFMLVGFILIEAIGIESFIALFLSHEALIVIGCGLLATSLINFPAAQLKHMGGWLKSYFFQIVVTTD